MTEMPGPSEPAERSGHHGRPARKTILGDGREVSVADLADRSFARLLDPIVVCLLGLAAAVIAYVEVFLRSFCSLCGHDHVAHDAVQRTSLVASLVVFGVLLAYESAGIRESGQTRGKRRRHIRVVDRADGEVPSPEQALVRSLVPAAVGVAGSVGAAVADLRIPALVGLGLWLVVYLSAMWGEDRRGWHDKAAGTVVIDDPGSPAQPKQSAREPGSDTDTRTSCMAAQAATSCEAATKLTASTAAPATTPSTAAAVPITLTVELAPTPAQAARPPHDANSRAAGHERARTFWHTLRHRRAL